MASAMGTKLDQAYMAMATSMPARMASTPRPLTIEMAIETPPTNTDSSASIRLMATMLPASMSRPLTVLPTQTSTPINEAASTTWMTMATAFSVARRVRRVGVDITSPMVWASISPPNARAAEVAARNITANGTTIEYISPV